MATAMSLAVLCSALPALAAPDADPSISGTVRSTASTASFVFTANSGRSVTSARFTTQLDPGLPADAASASGLTINGHAPPTAPTVNGGQLSIDLGRLTANPVTLAFSVPIAATTTGRTSSTATLTADGSTSRSAAVVLTVGGSDLSLHYRDRNHFALARIIGGGTYTQTYDLTNAGSVPVPTELVIDAPVPLATVSDVSVGQSRHIACTTTAIAGEQVCPVGPIASSSPSVVELSFTVPRDAVVGARARLTVSARPAANAPGDPTPADNTLSYEVTAVGHAQLTVALSPTATTVAVGDQTTITVSIRNNGPQVARGVFGSGDLGTEDSPGVRFVGFDGRQAEHRPATGDDPRFLSWYVGDLPVGRTVTGHIAVQGVRVPGSQLQFTATSKTGDPTCKLDVVVDPCFGADSDIVVTAARPTRTSTHPPGPTATGATPHGAGAGGQLANTGSPSTPLTVLGLVLLATGGALTRAGLRRR